MFIKGTMKDIGIDVTLRNNPSHVLAPDNPDIVRDFKFGKIDSDSFNKYYRSLLKDRWGSRREEFLELAKRGKSKDIKLKCTCGKGADDCHASIAAKFLNKLSTKL